MLASREQTSALVGVLDEGLRKLGYVEGTNLIVERRFADGRLERLPTLAAALVQLRVDVLVAGPNPEIDALRHATTTIPIVMVHAGDPIGRGLGITMQSVEYRGPEDFDGAFATMVRERADGFVLSGGPVPFLRARQIVALAAQHRLPGVYTVRAFVEAGGLMSYAPSLVDLLRRSVTHIDKILKGVSPADLPVEQPTTLELVINRNAAKGLGLTIPQSLLLRADQVIE